MASDPVRVQEPIRFGEDFQIDVNARRLRRRGHVVKLERIPLEILVLLLENRGEIVTRDEIVAKVWGKDVFLDTDNSIRGAIRKIRQVLKDNPEEPRFIQTVTGQGYRFVASIVTHEDEKPAIEDQTPIEAHPAQAHSPLHARRWLALGVVAVLAVLAVIYVIWNRTGHAAQSKIKSLAVLPLKNLSGDPAQEYLADGMTEDLIGRLSGIRDLRVTSRTSVMRFKDTQLSVPEIAKTLGVDAVVEGSVIREGSRIRVHAQLIRASTDEHFWSESYDRELRDALALESDVAQSIARKVEVTVTGAEHERLTAARHISPEVYESYLRGRFTVDKDDSRAGIEKSIGYFEEAINRDPTFAPAYVDLAAAYLGLSTVFVGGASPDEARPKAVAALRKALELDPEVAKAHALLANVYRTRWQWTDSEAEYKRALELNPNDAAAHLGLATWLMCQGRTEEAVARARHARELDPMGIPGSSIAWILFHSRRYDEAIRELHSDLAVHPDNANALWFLGFVLVANRQSEEAIPVLEKTLTLMNRSPGAIGVLVRAYAHAGRRADALRLLAELKRRKQTGYVPAGAFVNSYLGLADHDQAFAWLEQAYKEQSNILQFLKVHPFFDPVRGDPRFKDLLRRVGLDQAR